MLPSHIYVLPEGMYPWTPVLGHEASSATKQKYLLIWVSVAFDCLP